MPEATLVLLSGGASTRFWPLPHKMLMEFCGKTFLEHQLDFFSKAGFKDIVLVLSPEVAAHIASPLAVTVIQKGDGQGAALLSAAKYITGKPIVVVNADDLISESLLLQIKTLGGPHNLLVGRRTDTYFPGGYLVLDGKRIMKIHEKPGEGKEPSSYTRLVCDFFTNSDELLLYLEKNKRINTDKQYEDSLSAMMQDGIIFEMVEYNDTWIPLKYPWHTLSLMDFFLGKIKKTQIATSATVHKTASITGPVVLGNNVRVMEFTKLVGPLFVGSGTIIGNHTIVRHAMIGEESVVGFGSDITRSYVGNNVWLHTNYVGDSVIANDVALGAGAVLANLRLDEGIIRSSVKKEKISTSRNKLGAIIGMGARIGVEAQLMPGIKVGKNSVVGPGVQLKADLVDNKACYIKQELIYADHVVSDVHDRKQFRKKI